MVKKLVLICLVLSIWHDTFTSTLSTFTYIVVEIVVKVITLKHLPNCKIHYLTYRVVVEYVDAFCVSDFSTYTISNNK